MKAKTKGQLIILGSIIVIGILIVMISSKFKKETPLDTKIPDIEKEDENILVEEITDIDHNKTVKKDDIASKDDKPIDDKGEGLEKEVTQKLQEDIPEKPTYTKEELEDPTKTSDGEKVENPESKPIKKEEIKKEEVKKETSKKEEEKKKEEKKKVDNKNKKDKASKEPEENFPGFGYVPYSGPNIVIHADSDGDINKQVGIMD